MTRVLIAISAVSFLVLGACTQASVGEPAPPAPSAQDGSVEKVVYVAAETRPCVGVAPTTCLQVREAEDQPWTLHYFGYEGFEHEPGVEYRLRVRGTPVADPPADGSSIHWSLLEILDQRPVQP